MFYLALRYIFLIALVRPLTWIVLGTSVRQEGDLPLSGPAIIVANHNSHLDTIVLMSLFPLKLSNLIRPVAAEDYFFKNRFLKWFATRILNVIPIFRTAHRDSNVNPLDPVSEALNEGSIVIYYPEGTRGEPERIAKFKSGIARLAERHPDIPIIPVFMHGLGKALPKGETVLVPFICDIVVGKSLKWSSPKETFLNNVETTISGLARQVNTTWE
jgi:1-acyl-sn-glycerol-3-phosphate acyltransferase